MLVSKQQQQQILFLSKANMLQFGEIANKDQNNSQLLNNPEDSEFQGSNFMPLSPLKNESFGLQKLISYSPNKLLNSKRSVVLSRQAHKLTVRKLPKFHEQIRDDDPLKHSKIIENINYLREADRRKLGLNESQINTYQQSRVYDGHFEVSRVMVDLKASRHPAELNKSRSISRSNIILGDSRMSAVEGLKSGNSMFQSMIKQQNNFMQSKPEQLRRNQSSLKLASSRYFAEIIGNQTTMPMRSQRE